MKRDNLAVILENMENMIKTVCEGHEVIRSEIAEFSRKTDERFDLVDVKFMAVSKKIDDVDQKLSKRIDEVDEKLSKRIDEVDEKLSKRIDEVDQKLTAHIGDIDRKLSKKIDAVSTDLSAHRADTEAHRGVYRVKESE